MTGKIPDKIKLRMEFLEQADTQDRTDGTSRMRRLRQVSPKTGVTLQSLALEAPKGQFIEIGTSAGYSALWISLACRERGCKLTTFEILPAKIKLAKATFEQTGVDDIVSLVEGNAIDYLEAYNNIAFCFLDVEKELYRRCYDLVVPNMVVGGILVADNVISHRDQLADWLKYVQADKRARSEIFEVGKGLLVARKV